MLLIPNEMVEGNSDGERGADVGSYSIVLACPRVAHSLIWISRTTLPFCIENQFTKRHRGSHIMLIS